MLTLSKADSFSFTLNIIWYSSFCLYFSTNEEYQELKNGTIPPFQVEGKGKKNRKFTISKTGNKKLEDDFVYTQKHKNIWNSFCNFLDERFAEDDMSEILLDAEEIFRLKIPPTIPALLEFIPSNVGDVESDEDKRARIWAQALSDKSYASKEAAHLEGRTQEIEAEV